MMGGSRKRISICIVIFIFASAVLLSCSEKSEITHNTADTKFGVNLIGGKEGEDWEINTENGFLIIWKDGITLSGEVTADLQIVCKGGVSSLAIKDLKGGNNKVCISAYPENTHQFTLRVNGENALSNIQNFESLMIKGDTQDGQLELSGGVRSEKNLNVKNVSITAGGLRAFKNIEISGNSKVFLRQSVDEEELLLHARLYAGKRLNISLDSDGIVDIRNTDQYLPILANKSFKLGENTMIACPENGIIKNEDSPYGPDCRFVFDAEGNDARDVVIVNQSIK